MKEDAFLRNEHSSAIHREKGNEGLQGCIGGKRRETSLGEGRTALSSSEGGKGKPTPTVGKEKEGLKTRRESNRVISPMRRQGRRNR